jgi:hypothetical protein
MIIGAYSENDMKQIHSVYKVKRFLMSGHFVHTAVTVTISEFN